MIRYEEPIIKKVSEMKFGDVFVTEYGIEGNRCKFVFERCESGGNGMTVTYFHRIGVKNTEKCYEYRDIVETTFTVVGRESA